MAEYQKMTKNRRKINPKSINAARKIVPVLGINVDSTGLVEVLNQVQSWIRGEGCEARSQYLIVTPNPEIVNMATSDLGLTKILNSADLALPDGTGLVWAMGLARKMDKGKDRKRLLRAVTGRVVFEELVRIAAKEGWKVFLVGGRENVASRAAQILNEKYKILNIKYAQGPWLGIDGEPVRDTDKDEEKQTIEEINKFNPDLLFVGFGAPKQEKWLARVLPKLDVRVAMAVGGAFDYVAGIVPKPPKAFEDLGLEWLWRLIVQPGRVKRVFNATVVFPLKVLLN